MNLPQRLVLLLALMTAVISPVPAASSDKGGGVKVVASIFPLMNFAREVGGGRVEVSQILPPGAEIHSWQPSARQILELNRAKLFIYMGGGLEPWAQDMARSRLRSGLMIFEASKSVTLNQSDPHIWLDFSLDCTIVDGICRAFVTIDPGNADFYRHNAAAYNDKLRALDMRFKTGLETCSNRTLVTGGHAAFGYLAARYGLTQVALYGLSPDSEPTPRRLIEIAREVKDRKIPAVFFETTVNPKLARLLAEETGAEALPLNDGANIAPEQAARGMTFLQVMDQNLENLRHGLHCR